MVECFRKNIAADIGSKKFKLLAGACVATQTVHMVNDMALAERCLTHVKAAKEASYSDLLKHLSDFALAGQESPDVLEASATTEGRPPIEAGNFELSNDKPQALFPYVTLNPHAVLDKPPLAIGRDGYAYRCFSSQVDLPEVRWRQDDGSEGSIRFELVKGPTVE